jgi:hypothetical protein
MLTKGTLGAGFMGLYRAWMKPSCRAAFPRSRAMIGWLSLERFALASVFKRLLTSLAGLLVSARPALAVCRA